MMARTCCSPMPRRAFLADVGMGFTGLALGALLAKDGVARADGGLATQSDLAAALAERAPRAKSVIWLFMVGGASQVETFDPKPMLNRYAGLTINESPFKSTLDSPFLKNQLPAVIPGLHHVHPKLFPMQVGWRKRGESGVGISDWWPHLVDCADDIAFVRSMWTTDNNHGAQLQFHTGRHSLEGDFPTIGSWVHYGLGSLCDDLPQFVVLGRPIADCCGGAGAHGANYLGPEHDGVQLAIDPKNPLPFAGPGPGVYREEQRGEFELLNQLDRLDAVEYPADPALRARIKSYELAFRMQTAVPEIMHSESAEDAQRSGSTGSNDRNRGRWARCAWRPGGWSSAVSASCRFFTAATAAPVIGTRTGNSARDIAGSVCKSISPSPG